MTPRELIALIAQWDLDAEFTVIAENVGLDQPVIERLALMHAGQKIASSSLAVALTQGDDKIQVN